MEKEVDIVALGELLIDFTEAGYGKDGMKLFEQNPGGAPANLLTVASHMGYRTSFIGKVGKDMHGAFLKRTLQNEGIAVDHLIEDDKYFTTLAFVEIDENGERKFSFARKPGADTQLRKEELDATLLQKIQHQLRQGGVVPAGAQRIRQLLPARVQFLVKRLQRPLQYPGAQQLGLTLVQHPEIRRQGVALPLLRQEVGALPQQRRAEGVHRLDVRPVHPQHLPFEMLVPRLLGQALGQLRGDLAPQFRRGGLGIGDDEEVIHIAVLLRHIAEEPLHQHLGLAGTGGGGYQQRTAAIFHHGSLLGCQFSHHAHLLC